MTPTEVKTAFQAFNDTRAEGEPFIYVVRGHDAHTNSNEEYALAARFGFNFSMMGENDKLVLSSEPMDTIIKHLQHYQLFDFVGKYPRVEPSNNLEHALTNRLSPVFEAKTRTAPETGPVNDAIQPPPAAPAQKPMAAA